MSIINFFKTIGRGIVAGAKAVFSFLTGASTAAKVVRIATAVVIPVAVAVVEIVKTVKRVKENKNPSNMMEQALVHDDDNDMGDSHAKSSYRNTVKRIANNIGKPSNGFKAINSKKDLMKELKRTCDQIDRDNEMPLGKITDREMRAAREEMNRIARRVQSRRRFA